MKQQFNQMIHYYIKYLSDNGSSDAIKDVIFDFCSYLEEFLSEEQLNYIQNKTNTNIKYKKDAITLIKAIKKDPSNKEYINALETLIKEL